MNGHEKRIETTRFLIARVERLSVDSYLAHRASGLRGSLLRWLEQYETQPGQVDEAQHDALLEAGRRILNRAAGELRAMDEGGRKASQDRQPIDNML